MALPPSSASGTPARASSPRGFLSDAGEAAILDRVSFDPYAPYGPLVESSVRVVTWNVWGRYGPRWETRQLALEDTLAEVAPDLVCLIEAWRYGESDQPGRLAARLGMPYHHFVGDWQQEDWVSGIGLVSRWPMSEPRSRPLRSEDGTGVGQAVHVVVEGGRGPIQLFAVMLDYPLDASGIRQGQVKQLAQLVREIATRRDLIVLCGDFNAGPDSDEIRMLTGRSATAHPGLVFYDSWELAGDGSPGYTWSNRNPLAALGLYPDRRFDYIFSAWPRRGGVGHPVHCALLGVRSPGQDQISDHYGVTADLRY
jgi:endonuclease/exonuclease/phosphatase family metal-dependent hydrolase